MTTLIPSFDIVHARDPVSLLSPRTLKAGLLIGVIALGACGGPRQASANDGTAPLTGEVTLIVENRSTTDLNIFVLRPDGSTARVGRSIAAGTRTFSVPSSSIGQVASVRFVAEPIGTRSGFANKLVSQVVQATPGTIVDWLFDSRLDRSIISVR
jgi:hypothetical protein